MLDKYPNDVKLVVKNFPIPSHKYALKAATAALAANIQGKYWEFHTKLFENQKKMNDTEIQDIAKALGLDMEKFNKDMESPAIKHSIAEDVANGRQVGVRGTPTVFINGKALLNRSLPGFYQMIDKELKKEAK